MKKDSNNLWGLFNSLCRPCMPRSWKGSAFGMFGNKSGPIFEVILGHQPQGKMGRWEILGKWIRWRMYNRADLSKWNHDKELVAMMDCWLNKTGPYCIHKYKKGTLRDTLVYYRAVRDLQLQKNGELF